MNRSWIIYPTLVCMCWFVSPAWAVKPATWVHEQPKDFLAGKLENVVVSSLGELMLGRKTDTFFEPDDEAVVINALACAGDGKIYAATGPYGIIYQIDGRKVKTFATLPGGGTIFSLLFTSDGKLLAGTGGGPQAKVYTIDGTGRCRVFYEPPKAKYVWAMARGTAGEIYMATGVEGQLHVVDPDGTNGKVFADVKPKNLLCLAFGSTGMLYAGTDTNGLVYRIDPADGKVFVLYDAKEPEISSIVVDHDGNVYAATAAAEGARPGRAIAGKPGGKPEKTQTKPSSSESTSPASKPADKGNSPGAEGGKSPTTKPKKKPNGLGRAVSKVSAQEGGNAIYRIDTDDFVTEIFRKPVIILAMAEDKGTIYAGSGNEGRIYMITPAEDRITELAKLESSQVTALMRLPDKQLMVATANVTAIVSISDGYASKGSLIGKPLDAGQIVKWGRLKWNAQLPKGTKLTIATRSSNVEDQESEAWEDYSEPIDATVPQQISSANARFLQYKLAFETTVPSATPTLTGLRIVRIEENRPPRISTLDVLAVREAAKRPGAPSKIKSAAGSSGFGGSKTPPPDYKWAVMFKAEDPNKDPLVFDIFYREIGSKRWVRMAKDAKDSAHIWDTRTVSDGEYEVRVVAKDSKGNPAGTELTYVRISESITVDNTLPEVAITAIETQGKDAVEVHAKFKDSASMIAQADYTVDSDDEWQPLAADDDIFDSPEESATFTIEELEAGEHRIALRIRDSQGNTRYVAKSVTIAK